MHLVPGCDLLNRPVAPQRLKRNLRLEIRRKPSSCRHLLVIAVFLLQPVEYTLNPCPIFRDHLTQEAAPLPRHAFLQILLRLFLLMKGIFSSFWVAANCCSAFDNGDFCI